MTAAPLPALPARRARPAAALLLALAGALPATALAQPAGICRENAYDGRPVNPGKSELWQMQIAQADGMLMAEIAGRWYSEITADIGGQRMVNRQVQSFDASGAYGYEDQTCSLDMPQMPCSSNQGYGRWVAFAEPDGSIRIVRNFSDLNRQDECAGFTVVLQGQGYMTETGSGQVLSRIE